jgi:hypothetical protein
LLLFSVKVFRINKLETSFEKVKQSRYSMKIFWQTITSGYEGFADVSGTNSFPNSALCVGHVVISFGATKPPAHPEYGDGVISLNVGKSSQFLVLPNHKHTLNMGTELFPETSGNHSFGATKPQTRPEYGDGVISQNVGNLHSFWCYQTTNTP